MLIRRRCFFRLAGTGRLSGAVFVGIGARSAALEPGVSIEGVARRSCRTGRKPELSLLEHLAVRLPDLVGIPLSVNALRKDLQVAHQTISRWIGILERLYQIFRIYPFGAPTIRAVKKEAKHYQLDWTLVGDPGARFENLVACHLLKENHFIEDTEGIDRELRYFRDVEGREVDFVVLERRRPIRFVECKLSGRDASPSLRYLHHKYPGVPAVQVAAIADFDIMTKDGVRICAAARFLSELAA